MKIKGINALFRWTFNPTHEMKRRFPKAARKKRVRNKWRNRFDDRSYFEGLKAEDNYFLKALRRGESWRGGQYCIPVIYEKEKK